MTTEESANLATVRAYIKALESGAVGEALASFSTSDAVQIELPNKLNPQGGQSDLPTLLMRAEQGQKLLQHQTYKVRSEVAQNSTVAVEAEWSAVMAVPIASLPAGATMRAHFAMFFEFSEGRISRQRNYDCFDPW
ncbi:nuclear transport factor 2 family protein [Piscinibacter gummiphilus]|uniref:Nuclear transport factor 2 family protein n=1 Tax=Piscinibacter gummiphilus TaxID=946333 RepID=A0ABZ0CPS3_9BURK|nr:nuclear transport factor 2 family protein [Piscinibacter gummiphilus]WOB06963.1 nuclear transport factor 2 family protein [Piscinibacter gummiphilus]